MGLYQHWATRLLCLCVLLSHTYLAADGLSTSTSGVTTTDQSDTTTPTTADSNSNSTYDYTTAPPDGNETSTAANNETSTPYETSTATEEPTTTAPGGSEKTAFNSTDWAIIGVTSAIPVIVFIVSILLGIYRVRHEQNMLAKKMEENTKKGMDNLGFEDNRL